MAATHVTLRWDPGPLSKQDGLILYYQIGLDGQNGISTIFNKALVIRKEYKGNSNDFAKIVHNNGSDQTGIRSF